MTYKRIAPDDRTIIQSFTLHSQRRGCDYAFSNLCSWGFLYEPEYAIENSVLYIRFHRGDLTTHLLPIAQNSAEKLPLHLFREGAMEVSDIILLGVDEDGLNDLRKEYPNLQATANRDRADYIYLRENLASLSGKALQPKRNHCNKFEKTNPSWIYETIDNSNIKDCLEMSRYWCIVNGCEDNEGLGQECSAVTYALRHFDELALTGGLIRVDEKVVAFTFGSPINHDTFGVHVEKAAHNVDGSYSIINREFARRIPTQYTYVNREEDLGVAGLRKAKLSYSPDILLEKYQVVIKP